MVPVYCIFRGQSGRERSMLYVVGYRHFLIIFLAGYLLNLSSVVSADHYAWKHNVPVVPNKMTFVHSQLASVNMASGSKETRPYYPNYSSHSHHPHNHQYQHQRFISTQKFNDAKFESGKLFPSLSISPSTPILKTNDVQVNFDYDSAHSSPFASAVVPSTVQNLVSMPRSLSSLPSTSFQTTPTTTYTNRTLTATTIKPSSSNSTDKLKSKKNKLRKVGKVSDAETLTTKKITSLAAPLNVEMDAGTGRTFFLTPLLAYLFPVFIAQMFGMGMIPAAALITLPIFLLPIGLLAAVFLI